MMTRVIIALFFVMLSLVVNADENLATPPEMSAVMMAEAEVELLPENVEKTKTVLASEYLGISPVKDEEPANEIEVRGYRGSESITRLYLQHQMTDNVVVYLSAGKSKSYEGATIGLGRYLTPEMGIGISIGGYRYAAENEDTESFHPAISSFWYWKNSFIESEITVEHYQRDPHPWYFYAYAQTPVSGCLSAGFYGEKRIGWGPRLNCSLGKGFSLWVSPILKKDGESKAIIAAGVRKVF